MRRAMWTGTRRRPPSRPPRRPSPDAGGGGRACRDRGTRFRAAVRRAVGAHRDHFANLAYLTRFDPRFEEALLILVPGRAPVLLVGNEGVAYAAVVPSGVDVIRYQSFSLVNQPRAESKRLPSLLAAAGLGGAGAGRNGA